MATKLRSCYKLIWELTYKLKSRGTAPVPRAVSFAMIKSRTGYSIPALALALLFTGCSVNEFGIVAVERTNADGAFVYRFLAPGIHFNTRYNQSSVSVGLYQSTYVFPMSCGDIGAEAVQPYSAPFSKLKPQLSATRVIGLQLTAGQSEAGITLGLREQIILASHENTASVHRSLYYRHGRPAETVFRFHGNSICKGK